MCVCGGGPLGASDPAMSDQSGLRPWPQLISWLKNFCSCQMVSVYSAVAAAAALSCEVHLNSSQRNFTNIRMHACMHTDHFFFTNYRLQTRCYLHVHKK